MKNILLFSLILLIASCTKIKVSELNNVTVTGNAVNTLSPTALKSIESISMSEYVQEYYSIRETGKYYRDKKKRRQQSQSLDSVDDKTYLKLWVIVDSIITENDYLNEIEKTAQGLATIEVYLEPHIIKGRLWGRANFLLRGNFGQDYFQIQSEYFEKGDIEKAVLKMAQLLSDANNYSISNIKIKPGAVVYKGIDDILDFSISFLKPRSNLIGKIIKPIWSISIITIDKTLSFRKGFIALSIFFFIVLFILFLIRTHITKRRSIIHYLVIISNLMMLFTLLVYSYFVCRPTIPNILALSTIYNFDVSNLIELYSDYNYVPASKVIVVISVIAWALNNILREATPSIIKDYEKSYEIQKLKAQNIATSSQVEKKDYSDDDPKQGLWGAMLFPIIITFTILDRYIVMSLMYYLLVHCALKIYNLIFIKRVYERALKHNY